MKGDHAQDHCPRCHGLRERHIDRKTGRYDILMPTRCETKDHCEAEIMAGFVIEPESKRPTERQIEDMGDIALQLGGFKIASEQQRQSSQEFMRREIEAFERSLPARETSQG